MSTADLDIVSVGVASGSGLIEDIKASITTWTKDGTATGHFNVANSAVIVGCLITFADALTAIIVAKTGDGTGANSITLSVDHVTDSGLVSITGLIYSSPNVEINEGDIQSIVGASTVGNDYSGARTCVEKSITLPNNAHLTAMSFYSEDIYDGAPIGVAKENGSNFDCILVATVNKSDEGEQSFAVDYTIPATGVYHPCIYYISGLGASGRNNVDAAGGDGQYITGDYFGETNVAMTDSAMLLRVKVTYQKAYVPSSLFVVHTNTIQLNTSPWAALVGIAVTQTLGTGAVAYHAASVNKGGAAESWWVYLSSAWHSIVVLTSGTWQYRDAGGTLQNATINSRLGALAQAFGISQNRMSKTALEAITAGQWAAIFVSGTLDFACGLQASGENLAALDKWTATYTPKPVYALAGPGYVAGLSAFGG